MKEQTQSFSVQSVEQGTDTSLLNTVEQEQRPVGWNDARAEYPKGQYVHALFDLCVEQHPDTIALVHADVQLSYSEVNRRANQLAHYLQQQGVGPEMCVGLCLERSLDLVIAIIAVLKAGGCYVPMDVSLPQDRLRYQLHDAQVVFIITQAHLVDKLNGHQAKLLYLHHSSLLFQREDMPAPRALVEPHNLVYVIYTSGSTGRPKGTMITHTSLCNLVFWHIQNFNMQSADRATHLAGLGFDASVWELWPPLLVGASITLLDDPARLAPEQLLHWFAEQAITVSFVPTPLTEQLLEEWWPPSLSLRILLTGGDRLHRVPRTSLPFQLINNYGPTEATVVATSGAVEIAEAAADRAPDIGRAIANMQLYVLDEQMQPVPPGAEGELYLGGVQLARGYLHRPELTAERFVPHPFDAQAGARLYRTGDVVRELPNGRLAFVGRTDFQVKVRGYRIELGEIEHALLEHGAVRECVVVAREDLASTKHLVAYVVLKQPPREGKAAETAALQNALCERLPEYMMPSALVVLDAFPLTVNGKVDLHALPAPRQYHSAAQLAYDAPHTEIEQLLVRIWCQVLRLPQISIHDNFFALGGDSILGISMIAQARQAGLHMTMKQLYQAPTIAQLSTVVSPLAPSQSAKRTASQGMLALTPIQRWFFELHLANPHHWNQAFLFQLPPSLSVPLLEHALHWVFDQHDVFRLRFAQTSQDDWQAHYQQSTEGILFSFLDLRGLPGEVQVSSMTRLCTTAQASLHIGEGPLARALLFRLSGPQRYRLLLAIHHLVIDTVSWRVLLEDVTLAYRQLLDHRPLIPLQASSTFQHWAGRLVDYVQTETMHREYAFWLRQQQYLERPEHALPVDDPSGENRVALLRSVELKLTVQETHTLLRDVGHYYRATIEEVLLTALGLAFHDFFGRSDIVIDLEGHGREELFADVDLSRTVGWFTSKFPVLLELGAQPELIDALRMTKAMVRQLPQRGIGYGLLRYLHPDPAVRSSLRGRYEPQVSLNYLGQFDQVMGSDALFPLAPEPSGLTHGPENQRIHQLYVLAMIVEDQLHISWQYSTQLHRAETMQQLTQRYLTRLRQFISSSQQTTFPYIPDDFPLLRISQSSLDHLLDQICRSGRTAERIAISRQVQDLYPLSGMQAGLLFHSQAAPDSGLYVVQVNLLVEGNLHLSALVGSWQQLVATHPILRTSFIGEELLTQVVWQHVPLPLVVMDYNELSPEEQKQHLQAYQQEDQRRGFVEQRAPLLRLTLFQLGPQQLHLLWSFHHAILDAWSITLLLNELFSRYEMLAQDQSLVVPASRSYRDYILWLNQQDQQAAEQFWREELCGFTESTPLPLKQAHASKQRIVESTYGKKTARLSSMLSERLRTVARELQVTANTLMQASWAFVLSRYSGQPEVLFGMVVAGRSPELVGAESIVGLCVNTIPVRVPVSRQAMVGDWLRQIHQRLATIQHYDYYPLVQIQSVSEIAPGLPLFDSIFAFENHPVEQMQHGHLRVYRFGDEEQTHYPLAAVVLPGEQLELSLTYQEQLIEQETVARMLELWQEVLEVIGQQAEQRLADLPLLAATEREQVLITWNATQQVDPQGVCVQELFEQQAQQQPDAIALVQADAHLTYGELDRRANQLAHYLQRKGVEPEILVGVCLERSLELVVALVAVLKSGGSYVPMEVSLPRERLLYQLRDAQVGLVLTQTHVQEQLVDSRLPIVCLHSEQERFLQEPISRPEQRVQPQHLAYVIYTSGSVGRPKGTMITHASLSNLVSWHIQSFGLAATDRTMQLAGLGFDASVWELWPGLVAGASVTLLDDAARLIPEQLVSWLTEQASTISFVPTPIAEHLLERAWPTRSALRILLTGGDRLHRAPEHKLPFQLINNYGPTEATVVATSGPVAVGEVGSERQPDIGRAIASTQLYVLDAHMQPVPIGVQGELYLGGVQLARGYLGQAELTAERFVPHPFSSLAGARLYRTGDLVRYLPDGRLEFVGRSDFQVKVRGYRVELGEIEQALLEHPAVRECIVVAGDDRAGSKQILAYVVLSPAATPLRQILDALRQQLPDYMMPAHLVVLNALPLTANGKVDRKALPLPQVAHEQEPRQGSKQSHGPIADLLAGIWQALLHVPHVSLHDNFFALGGHSLVAMQVVARIREQMGTELPLRTLFEAPTLAALAERVQQELRAEPRWLLPPLRPSSASIPAPLSFAQERLWFLEQLEPGQSAYHVPLIVRLLGPLNAFALAASLRRVEARQQVLRLYVAEHEGQAVQELLPAGRSPLLHLDLSELAPTECDAEWRRLAHHEAHRPFDLRGGPLWRARLLRLETQEWVLLLTMHHVITDGRSMQLLLQELAQCYLAHQQSSQAPLVPLPIQYRDYAVWQRQWVQGQYLQAELAYWRERLAGLEPLPLPTDHPRPSVQGTRGAREHLHLDACLHQQLQALSQQEGVTLFMTLLAGWLVVLQRYSGQTDLAVGTPIANRSQVELEGLIGLFVNTLVLRCTVEGQARVGELLAHVREVTLGAYSHQEVPFEHIVEALQPRRELSHSPLFQVMFAEQQDVLSQQNWQGVTLLLEEPLLEATPFDLSLFVQENDHGIDAWMEYRTDLFEPDTVKRLLGHWQQALQALVAQPEQRVDELCLVSQAERTLLLEQWHATQQVYPQERCLQAFFEQQTQQQPDAIALVHGERHLSYGDLNQRATQVAQRLQHAGVGPEVLVGVCLPRTASLLVALLAVLKAGGAYVPLDPRSPPERLAFLVADAPVALLLSHASLKGQVPAGSLPLLCLDEGSQQGDELYPPLAGPVLSVDQLAYVLYTSGSTGRPKGVAITHRSVLGLIHWALQTYRPAQLARVLASTSVCFDLSIFEVFVPLSAGGCVVLAETALQWVEHLADQAVTLLNTVPSLLTELVRLGVLPACLHTVNVAGEPLWGSLVQQLYQVPAVQQVYNLYGPTEATTYATAALVAADERERPAIGRPISNTRTYVLDERMRVVPLGGRGELYLGGTGLARGYVGRAELTAERFVPDPFSRSPGERLYKTGDVVRYRRDGQLEFVGREDGQVKVRGYRIELGEIEHVLREHAGVRECVVVVREQAEGGKQVVAYVVPDQDQPLLGHWQSDLRGYLGQRLPEYMLPAHFVLLERLPLTANGKVDRRALPSPQEAREQERAAVGPQPPHPIAELLADLWQALLQVPVVRSQDNFFALGGHSLLAMQVVARLRQHLGIELPLRTLFETASLAELAQRVQQHLRAYPHCLLPPLRPSSHSAHASLSFAQERLWFLERLQPGQPTYHIPLGVRLHGPLHPAALAASVRQVEARQQVLRLYVAEHEGQAVQGVLPVGSSPLLLLDLSGLPAAQREQEQRRLAWHEAHCPFDLRQGPLWRSRLLRLAAHDWVLLLTL
ncbi:MAG: amino acid adenylation domain-containing protein, partial [Ktedonobacteraceae bacterium]|nr:amino acid adenylation domain-containing protein [Ktedonobacteraceae bacterium]